MAIDIRATVNCSLGVLITGSISDEYIQGSGLVKTRGSVDINGLITPAVGTVVTFSYVKEGVTRSIPRKLRVMSSFADPFRRTTKVELGCKLTYLTDLKDPINWKAINDPDNASLLNEDTRIVTLPISAKSVMNKCLQELGISASNNPLTNKFSVATFDLSSGYVQVLNDLLVSESYCGYLDTNEVLQVFFLDQQAGTGPVLTAGDIVEIGPIGVGQLPGEAVTVSYSTLKLKQPDPAPANPEEEEELEKDIDRINWEYSETFATPKLYYVNYVVAEGIDSGEKRKKSYTGSEATYTFTDYRDFIFLDEEGGQVLKEVPVKRQVRLEGNSITRDTARAADYLSVGEPYTNEYSTLSYTEEFYFYDNFGNKIGSTIYKYEPDSSILSSCSFDWVYPAGESNSALVAFLPTQNLRLTEQVSNLTENIKDYTREITSTYLRWCFTQNGQQSIAAYREEAGALTYSEAQDLAIDILETGVVHEETRETVSRTGFTKGQERPPKEERVNANYSNGGDPNNGWRTVSRASLELAVGSATAQRRIEFVMPYAPDDTFTAVTNQGGGVLFFRATPSDAPAKANRYGRVQNRLLLGNRNGVNLQVAPEKLPAAPYSPLYLQANGLTALYRANGTSWSFDSNGIVCSVDALFWAAVGGTGAFWFPVAPGITTLPTTPAVVNGTMTAPTTVLPYNETAIYEGVLRTLATVTKFEFSLTPLTVVPTFVLQIAPQFFDVTILVADLRTLSLTGQAAGLVRRYRLISAGTSFAATGFSAGSIRTSAIGGNVGTFAYAGQDSALTYQRNPVVADVGDFTLSGLDAGFTQGKIMAVDGGSFTFTGENVELPKTAAIAADAGVFTSTGEAANFVYTSNSLTWQIPDTGNPPANAYRLYGSIFTGLARLSTTTSTGYKKNELLAGLTAGRPITIVVNSVTHTGTVSTAAALDDAGTATERVQLFFDVTPIFQDTTPTSGPMTLTLL